MNERIKILAISGSLRKTSSNTNVLYAVSSLKSEIIDFTFYEGLEHLPHFNPELDTDDPPSSVKDYRDQLKESDGVIICTPEYARGVPGVLKNALDWVVSSGEFMGKPVAVISASSRITGGDKAHESIMLTLEMIEANIPKACTLQIPVVGTKINNKAEIIDSTTEAQLKSVLESLVSTIN
ncbi:NAD(P)H-dependent FMN reductase [Scopulibacillus darangshiensis]|uniref:NAD(P)H-dependent FMN reductase n=1 Tax=Scopulibacillus darangshiensis TaxID=442528 RepID=A0A4R2P5G8_9BACL|nr:NAD(P)H-dependent oxidoreductase [Scopulibacillus darangshiensis]TCP29025.1 NAD(P)H-dependent FMN reductase [Scopulibacillus darangshiensis]